MQSRYYSPFLKRFISLDDTGILEETVSGILGANLYAYCINNPTGFIDPIGKYPMQLSVQLYIKAFNVRSGQHINFNPSGGIGSILYNRLRNSRILTNRINGLIARMNFRTRRYNFQLGFYGKGNSYDKDLRYSLGTATFSVYIVNTKISHKYRKKYYLHMITVTVNDKYDFDYFNPKERGFIISTVNNFFGYSLYKNRIIKDYTFSCTFTYYGYFK